MINSTITPMTDENNNISSAHGSVPPHQPKPRMRAPKKSPRRKRMRSSKKRKPNSDGREVTRITRKMSGRLNRDDALHVALIASGVAPESIGLNGEAAVLRSAQAATLLAAYKWYLWSKGYAKQKSNTAKAQRNSWDYIAGMLDMKIEKAKNKHLKKFPQMESLVNNVAVEYHTHAKDALPPKADWVPQSVDLDTQVRRGLERVAKSADRASRAELAAKLRELLKEYPADKA